MKKKEGCYYCEQNENFRSLLFRICDLKASTVFLCRDQTLPGRCTIMFKDHNDESFQIPKDKINYGIYGDEVTHVHVTVCPKYRGKLGWGGPFVLFPEEKDKVTLTDEEYTERMELIRKAVTAKRGVRS